MERYLFLNKFNVTLHIEKCTPLNIIRANPFLLIYRGNESPASSEHRNSMQTIGCICQEKRKISGKHADLRYYYGSIEVACLEIGLVDSGSHGTKELNEVGIKAPIMMKSEALQISQQYGINMSGIKTVGFMIYGLNLTDLLVNFEGLMSLVTRLKRLCLPETVADTPRLFPLVLKLVFNAVQIVKGTINTIKEASTSVCLDNDNDLPFPLLFAMSAATKEKLLKMIS
ncbi:uncharacterized protein RHIMIDRAFT_293870 [Rhizopus microsporus ATCC 52813]|uniref:Uncharacterized protein n=1 Tax=Rhizopus microsporus ATCC 52813 TaxID=1340429 RepID=A0A2G4SMB0_RHIZD|nr:uncharacterized protein RHIMIDRAFT_293870 [Rhizopus microsporus ATCC 52813]PHZ09890.1 hypothetical protein RHIMIDRAFT_293870 [Rhizopus microsporus ATCC 52813]